MSDYSVEQKKAIALARARKLAESPQDQPKIDPNVMIQSKEAGYAPTEGTDTSFADTMYNSPVYQFMRGNAEIPGGLAGSMAGAAAGAPFGPGGMLVGGIVGGAVGSGAGSLLSDAALGEDLDFAKAVEEAAFSAGFDVATLGLLKVGKAGWAALKASGKTPEQIVKELAISNRVIPKAGTPESIAQSQATMLRYGGSLSETQTGFADWWTRTKEVFAREGILSSKTFNEQTDTVAKAVKGELNRVFGDISNAMSPAEVGEMAFRTINQGKQALGEVYGAAKNKILSEGKRVRVDTSNLSRTLEQFVESSRGEAAIYLDDTTLKVINDSLSLLDNLPKGSATVDELLKIEGRIMGEISKVGDVFNKEMYNGVASKELAELSSNVRDVISKSITDANPRIGELYTSAKNAYSKGLGQLLPEINKNTLTAATKDNFDSLGRALVNVGNVSSTKALMRSLDSAYAISKKAGKELPYESIRSMRKAVRQSYIDNLFKGADMQTLDVERFSSLAKRMETSTSISKMKAVLGEDYSNTKRILNLLQDATKKPESNLGVLALRQKEFGVAASAGAFLVGGGSPAAVAVGSSVLAIPAFWAKAATNPRNVNKLIAFQGKKFDNTEAMMLAGFNLVKDLADKDDSLNEWVKSQGIDLLGGEQ